MFIEHQEARFVSRWSKGRFLLNLAPTNWRQMCAAHLRSWGNGLANALALFQRTPQFSWQSGVCTIGGACLSSRRPAVDGRKTVVILAAQAGPERRALGWTSALLEYGWAATNVLRRKLKTFLISQTHKNWWSSSKISIISLRSFGYCIIFACLSFITVSLCARTKAKHW